jgi:hypothetical protein
LRGEGRGIFEQPDNNDFFQQFVKSLGCESILNDSGRGINALPETKQKSPETGLFCLKSCMTPPSL